MPPTIPCHPYRPAYDLQLMLKNYMASMPNLIYKNKSDRFNDNSMLENSKPHTLEKVQDLEKVYMFGWPLIFSIPSEKSKSTFRRGKRSFR